MCFPPSLGISPRIPTRQAEEKVQERPGESNLELGGWWVLGCYLYILLTPKYVYYLVGCFSKIESVANIFRVMLGTQLRWKFCEAWVYLDTADVF